MTRDEALILGYFGRASAADVGRMVQSIRAIIDARPDIGPSGAVLVTAPRTRLTAEQVLAIRREYRPGQAAQLATEYGCDRQTIAAIAHRRTWRHLPPGPGVQTWTPRPAPPWLAGVRRRRTWVSGARLTAEQVLAIRREYRPGDRPTMQELAARYSVSRGTISNIVHRRAWRHLPEAS